MSDSTAPAIQERALARRYGNRRAVSRGTTAEVRPSINSLIAKEAASDVAQLIRDRFADDRSDRVVALKTGYRARGVTAVKNGEHEVSFAKLFDIMSAYPDVAKRIEYWAARMQQPEFFEPDEQRRYHLFMRELLTRQR